MGISTAEISGATLDRLSAHKLFAPQAHQGAIHRKTILERIFVEEETRVILVQGPAGHGKSTLLQQAKSECEARGILTGWLTFDDTDNDPRRFFTHLLALLTSLEQTVGVNPGQPSAEGTGRLMRSDWFINRLIKLDRPTSIFFDDFHALGAKPYEFFRHLLERIPDRITLFIGSRSVPEIGLARLVVNHQAMILRADDLRFTPEEVTRFFDSGTLALTPDEVMAIYGQTDGWPAALQLYRLSLVNPAVRRSVRNLDAFRPGQLADYLADNVISMQPRKVKDFLLRTGPLSRLCASLCDAITGHTGSQDMLLSLEKSGLFLRSLDSNQRWFKYHALFAAFLEDQLLNQSKELAPEIHRRAMVWYRDNRHFEEAMHHAIAAREYAFAADVLDEWSTQLAMEANLTILEQWYDRLPLEEIERHPRLVIKVAWALSFLRRHHKLGPILEMLERQAKTADASMTASIMVVRSMMNILNDDIQLAFSNVENVDVHNSSLQGFAAFESGAAANLKGYKAMASGDFEDAREYLNIARAHGERAGATFSWGYSISTMGVNLMSQGLLREALERFKLGMSDPRILLDESVASAALVGCYIQALYEVNDLKLAELQFRQFHDAIVGAALLDYLAVAFISMTRIHDAQGRPAQAMEVLDELETISRSNPWPRLRRIVGWERVRRAVLDGDVERARTIASRIEKQDTRLPPDWVLFAEEIEGEAIGQIRLAIHDGSLDDAMLLINKQLSAAQRHGRVRRQIKLLILSAIAQKKGSDSAGAQRCLRKALQLAAPGQFVRIFLDEGREIVGLLREEWVLCSGGKKISDVASESVRQFLTQLVQASGSDISGTLTSADSGFQPLEALTERELQILTQLASGLSNSEIGIKVFVSENTVKFHLKNIFSKLGVSSRLQAISAARQMGLLST